MTDNRAKSPPHSSIQSMHIPIEYNVKSHRTNCCTCPVGILIACILFIIDLCLEYFLIFQWIHMKYYIPSLLLLIFIIISNICNTFQWYSFDKHTTFKMYHLIIFFGILGVLPLLNMIHYFYKCIKTNVKHNYKEIIWSKENYHHHQELLLSSSKCTQPLIAYKSSSKQKDIFHSLLSNLTQLLIAQCFVRIMPSICIQLFVLITAHLHPNNWCLTGYDYLNITMPNPMTYIINDQILLGMVSFSLFTYSFLSIICLDHSSFCVQVVQILFIICDCLLRTMPMILILNCDSIDFMYLYFAFEVLWCLEVTCWNEMYRYSPHHPMRKIYPCTFEISYPNETKIISSNGSGERNGSKIHKHSKSKYLSNETDVIPLSLISDLSQSAMECLDDDAGLNKLPKMEWIPADLTPKWTLAYEEYVAFCYGLFGGTLCVVSGCLIMWSLRSCVAWKQYRLCWCEILLRYLLSVVMVLVYCYEYEDEIKHLKRDCIRYWIWIVIFIACVVMVVPCLIGQHIMFLPRMQRQMLQKSYR